MNRFSIAYHVGEDFEENMNDVDLKDTECKITDTTHVLPDLIIEDEDVARKYIEYMNKEVSELKVNSKIRRVKELVNDINTLNDELVAPEYEIYTYEDDEGNENSVHRLPIEKKLFIEGYRHTINTKTKEINSELSVLKELLLKKD